MPSKHHFGSRFLLWKILALTWLCWHLGQAVPYGTELSPMWWVSSNSLADKPRNTSATHKACFVFFCCCSPYANRSSEMKKGLKYHQGWAGECCSTLAPILSSQLLLARPCVNMWTHLTLYLSFDGVSQCDKEPVQGQGWSPSFY